MDEHREAWDYGNHDELHRDCSCFYAEKPVRYKDIMGGLDRPQSDDVDFPRSENPNQIKGGNNMDLNALLDSISDVVRRGQDQLYGLEDKRNSIENIESEIQDAVSQLEGIQSELEGACNTLENLEDYLIPEAEGITSY